MLQEFAAGDGNSGRQRQHLVDTLEQFGELGDDVAEQDKYRDQGDEDQDGRVDQRREQGVPHFTALFHVFRQAFQYDFERTAALTGTQQVEVEATEYSLLCLHRIRECGATLDLLAHLLQQQFHVFTFRQGGEDSQRPVQRQAGAQQRGQFAGRIADMLIRDAPAAP